MNKRIRGATVLSLALVAILLGAIVLADKSSAVSTDRWQAPVGGCKEAYRYPQSQGARECRQHGWIVTRHTAFRDRLCANLLSVYSPGVRSDAASACRSNGWTIRPHFTINPHNELESMKGMKPCEYEDSNGCYWNAGRSGNGRGSSFVAAFNGEVFYVAGW